MDNRIIQLKQLLVDIDAVARYRGDKFGVCDCIDNTGQPYPSHFLQDVVLAEIKKQGFEPSVKQQWLSDHEKEQGVQADAEKHCENCGAAMYPNQCDLCGHNQGTA